MGKTLKNKDETMTIRVKKATKEKAMALHERTGTTATLASFLGDMVLLGLQVKEMTYKQEKIAAQTVVDEILGRDGGAKSVKKGKAG